MSERRSLWRRSPRLIATVICLDLVVAGLLVYVFTRSSGHSHTPATAAALIQPPKYTAAADPVSTTSSLTTTAARPVVHRHHHNPLAPSVMTNPDQFRAPKVSARDRTESSGASLDPTTSRGALAPNATASFRRLRARLARQARIAIAVQPLGSGRTQVFGGNPLMPAMSTSKIFILAALLADKGGVQHFTPEQKSLARTAITESDNDSILALFSDLEADRGGLIGASHYATNLIHKAGDRTTTVSTGPVPPGYATTFGQTPWSPAQEVTFFRALTNECLLPRSDVRYVLGLMRRIVPSERWGMGSAGFGHVAFKGGWGPLPGGYGVRQTGIINTGRKRVVVSIAADPATSFDTGQWVLDEISAWVRSELRPVPRPTAGCTG